MRAAQTHLSTWLSIVDILGYLTTSSSEGMVEDIRFRTSVQYALGFIGVLWAIKLLEWLLSADFGVYGIYPRTLTGTVGILVSPLIHGDFTHLFSNTFPLAFLGVGIMFFYRRVAVDVFLIIYLLTGVAVWFLARQAYHIGASGIIYGLVSFLFFSGLLRKDLKSITVSLVVLFLYSGMLHGLFPTSYGISWESHLIGAIAGLLCALLFRNTPLSIEVDQVPESEADDSVTFDNPLVGRYYTYTYVEKDSKPTSSKSNSTSRTSFTYSYYSPKSSK